jgi:hypothetical protein
MRNRQAGCEFWNLGMGKPRGRKSDDKKAATEFPMPLYIGTKDLNEPWQVERRARLARLRRTEIPAEIIDAAEQRRYLDRVWVEVDRYGIKPRAKVRLGPPRFDRRKMSRSAGLDGNILETTVAEFLAARLLDHLARLRSATGAPVRIGGKLSRSAIAGICFDILQDVETDRPGPNLVGLIGALLRGSTIRDSKELRARSIAAWVLAQSQPGVRQLANAVHVNPSTVSRWLREEEFLKLIERNRQLIADARGRSQTPRDPLWSLRRWQIKVLRETSSAESSSAARRTQCSLRSGCECAERAFC